MVGERVRPQHASGNHRREQRALRAALPGEQRRGSQHRGEDQRRRDDHQRLRVDPGRAARGRVSPADQRHAEEQQAATMRAAAHTTQPRARRQRSRRRSARTSRRNRDRGPGSDGSRHWARSPSACTRCSGPKRLPNSLAGAVTTPLVADTNVSERSSTGKASTAAAAACDRCLDRGGPQAGAAAHPQQRGKSRETSSGPSHGAIAKPSTSSAAAIAIATDTSRHTPAALPATTSGTRATSSASAHTVAASLIEPWRL